jgi:hypothetical protein
LEQPLHFLRWVTLSIAALTETQPKLPVRFEEEEEGQSFDTLGNN